MLRAQRSVRMRALTDMLDPRRHALLDAMGIVVWQQRSNIAEPVAPEAGAVAEAAIAEVAPATDDNLDALRREVADCTACALHETRTQTVFGTGRATADCLIIGEAPGAEEDRRGEPFVGRAGKLLNSMLSAIGLDRDAVFIANILKCRPPGNRDPRAEEVQACAHFLERQIALLQPRVILAVGRVAAGNLLSSDAPLGRMRGQQHYYGNNRIPVVVTYHPAYLLRSPGEKRKAWADLKSAAALLHEAGNA